VDLARLSWLVTVAICMIAAIVLLLEGFNGYAGVLAAIGLSAAINLR